MPKWGYVSGPRMMVPMKVGNAGAITEGDCVVTETSGLPYIMRATDGDIPLGVAAESCAQPTTDGDISIMVDISEDALYRLPVVTGTLAESMVSETCDIGVSGTIIGLDVTAATDKSVRIREVESAGAGASRAYYALCNIYFNKNANAVA